MSYPGLQGYGSYYPAPPNDQNGYGKPRQSGTPTSNASYPDNTRHTQYGQSDYSWPGQGQQEYGGLSAEARSYRDGNWGSAAQNQPTYNYQGRQASYPAPTSSGSTASNYYASPVQASAQSSTQGLNNLAYASGLESAGMQFPGSHENQPDSTAPSVSAGHQNTRYAPSRVDSPSQNTTQQYQQMSRSTSYQAYPEQTTQPQQHLAVSAAAALAGAMNRGYSNVQSPNQGTLRLNARDGTMGNAASSRFAESQTRSASPQVTVASQTSLHRADHVAPNRQQPSNIGGNFAAAQSRGHMHNANTDTQSRLQIESVQASQQPHDPMLPQPQRTSKPSNKAAHQTSSIANLVTNDISPEPTQQQDQSPAAMPSFIDPTQVFNPYHMEYERQKREAEAYANVADSNNYPDPQPITSSAREEGQTESRHPSVGSGKPLLTAGNERSRQSGSVTKTSANASVADTAPPNPKPSDDEMANEMKAMVERMREWKNKDPSLFQKLWEDMKKGGAAVPAASTSTPSPSPQLNQPPPPKAKATPARPRSFTGPTQQVTQTLSREGQASAWPRFSNGVKVVVENNEEGLPDLGRFPAERRVRGPYKARTPLASASVATLSQPAVQTQLEQATQEGTLSIPTPTSDMAPPAPLPVKENPLSQPLPPANSAGVTVWPEEKRKSLAEAAVRALNANPENHDKMISPALIHDMLEKNPSYIDLCKMLEDRGLKFHRGHFARHLLSQVPELTKAHPQQTSSQSITTQSTTAPTPNRPVANQPPPFQSKPFRPQLQMPYAAGDHAKPETPLTSRPAGLSKSFSTGKSSKPRLGVPSPNVPTPLPGSKEALARKRDFSELVDLTQLSDDEDYVMPSKQPRLEEPSPKAPSFELKSELMRSGREDPFTGFVAQSRPQMQDGSSAISTLRFNPDTSSSSFPLPPQAPTPPQQRTRNLLARPLNKAEALRKSYYDPKTVARDILIAAGRHPTERPLNAHLAGLLGTHIELDSDLSSFDWDAVDPGGPPMPRVQEVDIPARPPKWRVGERKADKQNHLRIQSGPSGVAGEPSRDKHRASPTVAAVQSSLARLSSQTKTILQDSQNSSKPSVTQPSRLRQSHGVDVQNDNTLTTVPTKPKAPSTTSPAPSQQQQTPDSNKAMEPRRRGRPPGAKNKHPSVTLMKKAARPSLTEVSIPSRDAAPPPPPSQVYECLWRGCDAKLHNLSTLRKHVFKIHMPSDNDVIDHGYTCWWKKCQFLKPNEDRTFLPTKEFQSYVDWLEHIEQDHLHPLGMELGDGPNSSIIGKPELALSRFFYHPLVKAVARICSYTDSQTLARDRTRFLSDENGRAVTSPATQAADKDYEPDAMVLTAVSQVVEDVLPVKNFLKVHGNEKMDTRVSALETLRAMEVTKERLGPGIDRGGCTLVNAERRATLLQDEALARVVDEDY